MLSCREDVKDFEWRIKNLKCDQCSKGNRSLRDYREVGKDGEREGVRKGRDERGKGGIPELHVV